MPNLKNKTDYDSPEFTNEKRHELRVIIVMRYHGDTNQEQRECVIPPKEEAALRLLQAVSEYKEKSEEFPNNPDARENLAQHLKSLGVSEENLHWLRFAGYISNLQVYSVIVTEEYARLH